jgi:hypothetical protein
MPYLIKDVLDRSVVESPSIKTGFGVHPLIMSIASLADEVPPWSTSPHERDKVLRNFWHKEPVLAGVVTASVARNASFAWEVVPSDPTKPKPKNTLRAVTKMLNMSDRGAGWVTFQQKILFDLFCQDNAAFIEVIRKEDRPDSPPINLAQLDSARCVRTGDPYYPVEYEDIWGKRTVLNWWNVIPMSLYPAPIEEAYGVQYSPLTVALMAAQILRDIAIYKREKVSGGNTRAIYFVTGVTQDVIDDAKAWSREQNMNLGLYRYSDPIVIPGLDPTNPVKVDKIDIASLPDNFDEESTYKWYMVQLANAFGMDYQEFAPLPGGNLGSSQQSKIQHQKTQGKGPALIMSKTEHVLNNNGILPETVEFRYLEHDLQSQIDKADAAFTRSKDRSIQLTSGYLDPEGALDMAVLHRDIPEHIAEGVKARGLAEQWYLSRMNRQPQNSSQQILSGMQSQQVRSYGTDYTTDLSESEGLSGEFTAED